MKSATHWGISLAATLVASAIIVTPVLAQPEDGPPPRREPITPQAALRALQNETDPQRAKKMLADMLAEARILQEQLQAGLDRIEKGEPTRDVARDLLDQRQTAREGIRERVADRIGERLGDRMPERPGDRDRPRPDEQRRGPGGPNGHDGLDGPGGPDGARFTRPGGFAKLNAAEREQLMQDFRNDLPDVAADLELLRKTKVEMADMLFTRLGQRYFEAREARRIDPQLADLRLEDIRGSVDVMRKTRAYRDTLALPETDANRVAAIAQATTNLREAITRNFDQRLAVQTREADMLARRLEDLRTDIAKKGERKEQFVDNLLDRMKLGLPPQDDDRPAGPGRDRPDRP
jgi:hypothetical protein